MSKSVLLIYPEIPVTYWSYKYVFPYTGCKSSCPPLGLLTVAAMLPDDYQLKMIDMNITQLNEEDIINSDMIFISAMIVQKESFEKAVKLCNKLGKTVVAGGPYPTSSYQMIEGVDHFILNECETILHNFIQDYEEDKAKKLYIARDKPNLAITPSPRFDLIDVNQYLSMSLQYSRGCPFNCEFCDIIEMFGRKPRTKMPSQFLKEMDTLYESGFKGPLFIVDDNFIGNKKNVKKLLPEITSWQKSKNYPFILYTESSVNLADDDELMEMMVEAGFNMVFLGIETPVEKSLIAMQKAQNVRTGLLESIKKIQRKGLEVTGGFIVGFDNDPENIFDLQIDFIQESGIPAAMVGILLALPKTRLYKRLKSENRLLFEPSGNNTHEFDINFIPKMEREKLISGYKKIIREIYKPKKYFERCSALLSNLPINNYITRDLNKSEIKSFFLSLYKQTFSSYGLRYLKFILSIAIKSPGVFPEAVRMAIIGDHFIKITNEILAADKFTNFLDKKIDILHEKLGMISSDSRVDAITAIHDAVLQLFTDARKKFRRLDKNLRNIVFDSFISFRDVIDKSINELERKLELKLETEFDG